MDGKTIKVALVAAGVMIGGVAGAILGHPDNREKVTNSLKQARQQIERGVLQKRKNGNGRKAEA